MGDFNCITNSNEKLGGLSRMSTSISPLLKFQQDGGFVDIQFNGPGYTWTNNRQGNSKILQRLDRALANSQWIMKFPFARLVHLPRVASDHCPLLLILTPNLHRQRKPFRIESWWFTLAGFKEKVKEIWLASADTPLQRRLRNMAYSLRKWASSHRLNLQARVAESINMLSKLQELPINHPNRDGEGTSITQLEDLMFKQELYWAQRAKDNWICNGDRNTKYFHMKATMRNRKNMITSLKNDAGKTVTDRVELQHLIDGHFEAFYTTPHTCDRSDSSWNIIKQHTPKISQVEANNMSAASNMTELREALFSMKPDKSPGPDGFSARFFQANWDLVKCGFQNPHFPNFTTRILDSRSSLPWRAIHRAPATPTAAPPLPTAPLLPLRRCSSYLRRRSSPLRRRRSPSYLRRRRSSLRRRFPSHLRRRRTSLWRRRSVGSVWAPGAGEKPPKEGKAQPYYAQYGAAGASPFAALVPSQFPPGTDPNVAACFHAADRDGSGFIDDKELQQALSSYNQSFSLRTVHLLMYLFTGTNVRKIGPKEFISVFYSLQNWRAIFERFDRDRSGKIDASELREALLSLGYAVSPVVLDLLVSKFDKSGGKNKAIEYDNFIECCLTVKGLTDKFKEKDTMCSGTATFTYESFMLTVLPFLIA
uniref:EF-hand domain-containing protein n=1 Tax=Ananas comosus var. bracteatus TaxID=296719 RepID=A0A6V7NFE8_ANACO|nr:unnamed protein product [Ananas comosus var. bracteatus]